MTYTFTLEQDADGWWLARAEHQSITSEWHGHIHCPTLELCMAAVAKLIRAMQASR